MDVIGEDRPKGLAAVDRGDGAKVLHDAGEGVRLVEGEDTPETAEEADLSAFEMELGMQHARDRAHLRLRCVELALAIRADKKGRVSVPCDSVLDDAKKLHDFVTKDDD